MGRGGVGLCLLPLRWAGAQQPTKPTSNAIPNSDNGVVDSCTGGGGGIRIHLGPWDPFDPAIPSDQAPIDDGSGSSPDSPEIDPETRTKILIQLVARDTKGFNNLMNCGAAAGLAAASVISDLSLTKEAIEIGAKGIAALTSEQLAYNSAMQNITGQNAAAMAVQRAATASADAAKEEIATSFHSRTIQ